MKGTKSCPFWEWSNLVPDMLSPSFAFSSYWMIPHLSSVLKLGTAMGHIRTNKMWQWNKSLVSRVVHNLSHSLPLATVIMVTLRKGLSPDARVSLWTEIPVSLLEHEQKLNHSFVTPLRYCTTLSDVILYPILSNISACLMESCLHHLIFLKKKLPCKV